MPICGSIPPQAGWCEKPIPYGSNQCMSVPCSQVSQPVYCSGQFCSSNPNATASIIQTDRSGKTTLTLGTASQGILGSTCLSNCGQGTGFFGLGGEAANVARSVAGVVAQVLPALTPIGPFVAAGSALAENVERSQSGMALNLSGILGAVGNIIGGANLGQYSTFGQVLGGGLNIASAALAPQPQAVAAPVYGPVYNPIPPYQAPAPPAVRTMAAAPVVVGAGMALVSREAVKILLTKIAATLGRRGITLSSAVELARKLGKFFTSPEAIATYMGLAVGELALLITAHSARKRRRMNPANSKALHRAARRIKSFHRLCIHTDVLKSRSRGARSRCGTCRKSPCRCR